MLRQLLKAFRDDSVLSISSLADKAGVQESILMQMLGELVRLGYLEENVNCATSCASCDQEAMCKPSDAHPQRLWTLSPKGKKFLIDA